MKEDIIGLHITMHNIILIQNLKGLEELLEDKQCVLFWQFPLFGEQALQSASVAVFVDKIEIIGSFEHVVVLDDVGVRLDVGKDIDFVDCTLL